MKKEITKEQINAWLKNSVTKDLLEKFKRKKEALEQEILTIHAVTQDGIYDQAFKKGVISLLHSLIDHIHLRFYHDLYISKTDKELLNSERKVR